MCVQSTHYPERRCRAKPFGIKPNSSITFCTRARVSGATISGRFKTFEAVPTDTPAYFATSRKLRAMAMMTIPLKRVNRYLRHT
jgi:hypothetical protein